MTPPPPRSTLFPYTTLFRSFGNKQPAGQSGQQHQIIEARSEHAWRLDVSIGLGPVREPSAKRVHRSEEHTSELQSQFHLVCRLLLEKKKKIINTAGKQKSIT